LHPFGGGGDFNAFLSAGLVDRFDRRPSAPVIPPSQKETD
jgi:hypothetical protein